MTELAADLIERQRDLRRAFSMFPSGVIGVCALLERSPVGLAASSFTSVSLQPPLVSICIDQKSTTWPRLTQAPRLGISVLGAEHVELTKALAAKEGDRFATATWEANDDGALFLHGATLWIDCVIHRTVAAGDHEIVLLEVLETRLFPEHAPLVFHQSVLRALSRDGEQP